MICFLVGMIIQLMISRFLTCLFQLFARGLFHVNLDKDLFEFYNPWSIVNVCSLIYLIREYNATFARHLAIYVVSTLLILAQE